MGTFEEGNGTTQTTAQVSEQEGGQNLSNMGELLHDVTMDIVVEMGRKQLKISELLNLSKGSVIELNQEIDEPLHIYANDKLIAKGNIISSNGKFCIKIL